MKKNINPKQLIIVALLFATISSYACDACGCSSGLNYMGIIPMISNNMIGLKYQHQSFFHPSTSLSSNGEDRVSKDIYQTTELWGRFNALKHIQVFYSIPYKQNTRIDEETSTTISGIGDIRVMANYNLIIRDNDSLNWKHYLRIGGHLSAPTGKYMQRDHNKTMLPLWFQTGTGTWGYGLQAFYTVRFKAIGLNLSANENLYSENEQSYLPGANNSFSAMAFYWLKLKEARLMPQMGVTFESYKKDMQYDLPIDHTGGKRLSLQGGVDLYYKRALVSVFANMPYWQSIPDEQPTANPVMGISVAYFLK